MSGSRRDGLLVACALTALLAGPAPARAAGRIGNVGPARVAARFGGDTATLTAAQLGRQCTREDAAAAAPGASNALGGPHPAAAPEATAITAEAMHALPTVTVESRPLPTPARRNFWPTRLVENFVDHFDLATRLRAIKRIKIVPVFDNARVTVFFGVDRSGIAGLHIQQQDANDLPPLLARNASLSDGPGPRSVPLRLP